MPQEIEASNLSTEDRRYLERHAARLPPAALRARWVHAPGEHEDMPGQILATRSHEVIRRWAGERNAAPAALGEAEDDGPPQLRFRFPGYGGGRLRTLDWDEWSAIFDEREMMLLFQEHLRQGAVSNFFQLETPLEPE